MRARDRCARLNRRALSQITGLRPAALRAILQHTPHPDSATPHELARGIVRSLAHNFTRWRKAT
jgi:hypothetical protein